MKTEIFNLIKWKIGFSAFHKGIIRNEKFAFSKDSYVFYHVEWISFLKCVFSYTLWTRRKWKAINKDNFKGIWLILKKRRK